MKRNRILVADDDRGIRSSLRARISSWGYAVTEAADGLGVVTQLAPGQLDAVILDQRMPNGDGRSLARVIRNECDVPIILISGQDRDAFRNIVFQLPDVFFIAKPIDSERLRTLLDNVVTAPVVHPAGTGDGHC